MFFLFRYSSFSIPFVIVVAGFVFIFNFSFVDLTALDFHIIIIFSYLIYNIYMNMLYAVIAIDSLMVLMLLMLLVVVMLFLL